MSGTTEADLREACVLIRDAVGKDERVTGARTGPRSNELWFDMADGREVRAVVQVIVP